MLAFLCSLRMIACVHLMSSNIPKPKQVFPSPAAMNTCPSCVSPSVRQVCPPLLTQCGRVPSLVLHFNHELFNLVVVGERMSSWIVVKGMCLFVCSSLSFPCVIFLRICSDCFSRGFGYPLFCFLQWFSHFVIAAFSDAGAVRMFSSSFSICAPYDFVSCARWLRHPLPPSSCFVVSSSFLGFAFVSCCSSSSPPCLLSLQPC